MESRCMKEISETETYKALYALYNKSLDNLEEKFTKEQMEIILNHERIFNDLQSYILCETNKQYFGKTIGALIRSSKL